MIDGGDGPEGPASGGAETGTPEGGADDLDLQIAAAVRERRKLKLELREPLEVAGLRIDVLEFRQMRGREWYDFPPDPKYQVVGDYLKVAARLTAQPESIMQKLCSDDVLRVVQVVSGFMARGR